jgi:cell division protein FtsL
MRRNQNLYRHQTEVKLGPISSGFVIVAIIAVLALLYLNAITKTSVFGYELTQLQNQSAQATSANQELQVEAARLTSIQAIQSSSAVKGLVPTTQVTYAK